METINVESIGDYIRHVREMAKLSRKELAKRSDRSPAWIKRLEANHYESPGIKPLQDVAIALGFESLAEMLEDCFKYQEKRRARVEDVNANFDCDA